MIHSMYWLVPHDTVNQPFVLRRMSQGKLVVMSEYKDLICIKCHKVNEEAALKRGIQPNVVVKSKRPFLLSADDFYLLDERGKDAFSTVFPSDLVYFRIPSSRFYVGSAKVSLHPAESDSGYRFLGGTCKECGRAREVAWGNSPPTIPQPNRFISIIMESRRGARQTWMVSTDVARQLEKLSPPLTGMVLVPKEIDDGVAA